MAIAYDGINYFPVGVNFMEENAMEVIEAKYGKRVGNCAETDV